MRVAAMFMARGVMQAGLMMLANPMVLAIVAIVAALGIAAYLIYANWDKIKAAFGIGVAAIVQLWNAIKLPFAQGLLYLITLPARMQNIGLNIVLGLSRGIMAAGGAVWNALKSVVEKGIARIKNFLGIKSPSRLFMGIGGHMAAGMEMGITNGGKNAIKAAGRLAAGAAAAGAITLSPVNAAQIGGGARASSAQIAGGGAGAGGTGAGGTGGGITINIYGAEGQDVNMLADKIMEKLRRAQGVQQRSAFDDGQ
jgi:hypothetical protein